MIRTAFASIFTGLRLRYVENFLSYVPLYLYVCSCHGLRLSDLNKETTYLLTCLLRRASVCPFVRLSNAWIVIERKKPLSTFVCLVKD